VRRLNNAALGQLEVSHPTYDRSMASVGIVHFGFGNFHRSHQALYLDRLMETGRGLDWGICGVGVLPRDVRMRDVMRTQDELFTVVLRHPDGSLEPRVVGSVLEYLFGPDDPEAVYARLCDPHVRVVTLTVTEGGYLKNAATGRFDVDGPDVTHDVQHLDAPHTAFAYIVEALRRRRDAGLEPFTVLSCDNLQGNGTVARQAVVGLANLVDPALADWIGERVAFPNCMVDRITPSTTDSDRESLAAQFGIQDEWPVPAEPFTQWIVEDRFPQGRPSLEEVGVQFVSDVEPYELMKLRLLNASHQALAYLGAPLGYVLVHDAMGDDLVRCFLERYMAEEAAPTLGDLPGIDLEAYMATLIERFANPGIRDTLVRLATDGGNRMATFTLPTVRSNLAAGRPVRLGAAMCAAWAEYWGLIGRGGIRDEDVPPDVHAEGLRATAMAEDPAAFIEQVHLFGDLGQDERFRQAFLAARTAIVDHGLRPALIELLSR
jgi:mannitol 2-dehydrogenase